MASWSQNRHTTPLLKQAQKNNTGFSEAVLTLVKQPLIFYLYKITT
jgi:hypothetical protein